MTVAFSYLTENILTPFFFCLILGKSRIETKRISSSLTLNSEQFNLNLTVGRHYYFEKFKVKISTNGYYTFSSDSLIDAYGCLYKDAFALETPRSNRLISDDDSGNNEQFQFTICLHANKTYFLIFTTRFILTTGDYTLIVSGPSAFTLTKIISSDESETSDYLVSGK